jgi:hypothetical protein
VSYFEDHPRSFAISSPAEKFPRDSGLLTAAQLRDARALVSQARKPTSSLFGTTARQQAGKKTGKKTKAKA